MLEKRNAPVGMTGAEFKQAGYRLIDRIAAFIDDIDGRPVTTNLSSAELSAIIGRNSLPENGKAPADIIQRATDVLLDHSLFNGHPRFFGYITSSAAPIGALADLLAAAVNPNVGAGILSPVATAIEKQVVKWLGEFIGVPACFDGLLVSGGNMANFTAFCTAIHVKIQGAKKEGVRGLVGKPLVYCSKATHTWIDKAASFSGIGSDAIRWIPVDEGNRMDISLLEQTLKEDSAAHHLPVMVIGTAGDVSTGAVDDLKAIRDVCKRYDCWFHVDGAYGAPAAVVPDQRSLFEGMADADSIAVDPHKWLYAPLEAGCTLVKDPNHLISTYSSHPVYYNFDSDEDPEVRNFYEYGFQNSRGFRALKVWMILQQAGRRGFMEMIATDIHLAGRLFQLASQHAELEAVSHHLSIVTFRYAPRGYPEKELNKLNELLLNDLQGGGEVFLSNAMINGKYCLRVCIVNFRTSERDIDALIGIVVNGGRKLVEGG
ncbi:MAG TPA: aminotransferase class V-fold PLP-dependent enzyme [Puia sp.]|nr:aminotransferase class V-fold PLP-dependent enzyme [Puia sp.]